MFTIRDSKAEYFYPPAYNKTHGEAERTFRDLAQNQETQIGKHPEDFDLYFTGEFDDQTGKVTPLDSPQHIVKAIALVNSTKQGHN